MSPSSPTPSSHRPLPDSSSSESPSNIRKPDLTLVYLINHLDSFDSPDDDMQASATDIIPGSAPSSIKEAAVRWFSILDGGAIAHAGGRQTTRTFGQSVRPKVEIVDVSLEPSVDDPLNVGMRMVCELDVTPDMCDPTGVLSHGCMTFLMDEGSAISLLLLRLIDDETQRIGVSQTFNFVFHHPPPPAGSRIRIVSRSISAQKDIGCCQCEIWDTEKHKLIISGQQLQMQPSMPQPRKSKL